MSSSPDQVVRQRSIHSKVFLKSPFPFAAGLLLSTVLSLSSPCGASSDNPAGDGEDVRTTEEIVVTASRYGEGISSVPAMVTVITSEEIERSGARSIPDLLRSIAAVQVNDIAGNERHFTVDLRGFGETAALNTLVLIDGTPVNQADLSGVDWMMIPVERVGRIEILHGGGGSVLYGDHASGGVVNIITREAEGSRTRLSARAGSYAAYRGSAHFDRLWEKASLSLSAGYLTSDGYRDNSATESADAGLSASFYPADSIMLRISGWFHDDDSGLPGAIRESETAAGTTRRETVYPDDFVEARDWSIKGSVEFLAGDFITVGGDLSFRRRDVSSFASFAGGNFTGETAIDTVTLSPRLLLKNSISGVANTLTIGADYRSAGEEISNTALFFGETTRGSFDLDRDNYGLYFREEAAMNNLVLSGGYRYDRASFTFRPSTPDSLSIDENLFTSGLNYTFHGRSYGYASYSRSFRYPVLDEIFNFFTNTITSDLGAQTTDNFEAGARHYLGRASYVHVNAFHSVTKEEIFFNPSTYSNENLDGKTRRSGIELSFETSPTEWLLLSGGYTYMHSTIDGGTYDGNDVPNVPEHRADVRTLFTAPGGLSLAIEGSYVGRRAFISDFGGDFERQEDHLIWNCRLAWQWKGIETFLAVYNLADSEYAEYGSLGGTPSERAIFPSPGRNVAVGVSYTF